VEGQRRLADARGPRLPLIPHAHGPASLGTQALRATTKPSLRKWYPHHQHCGTAQTGYSQWALTSMQQHLLHSPSYPRTFYRGEIVFINLTNQFCCHTARIISFRLCGRNCLSNDVTQISETHSYNVCLDHMKKAFEHCSILLVPSLCVALPFRQAFWTSSQSICCDHEALTALTC
jgi:hypothetical protein